MRVCLHASRHLQFALVAGWALGLLLGALKTSPSPTALPPSSSAMPLSVSHAANAAADATAFADEQSAFAAANAEASSSGNGFASVSKFGFPLRFASHCHRTPPCVHADHC